MKESPAETLDRWEKIVRQVAAEWLRLEEAERQWVAEGLEGIFALQERMHERFLLAGGRDECGRCQGQCCDCGRNHFTLVNLLGYLARQEDPPLPDFSLACPFLGDGGCRLDIARRPFNCVTFVCGEVEARMSRAECEAFYAEEAKLRRLYERFDRRFALSSPRGILIRAPRLGREPLLCPANP